MIITLVPVRDVQGLTLHRQGDQLTINGTVYDFAAIGEGDVLPKEATDCEPLLSDVTREGGQIRLTLRLPHGPNAPHQTRFPDPIVDPANGPVTLPPYNA